MEQLSPEEREARRVREAEARQAALEQIYMGTGGIEDVLRSMRMYPQDAGIQEHGCMALLNLAYNNTDNEVKIVKAGGIEAIISAMKAHPGEAKVQEEACRALGSLAYNADNKVKIANAGGIEVQPSCSEPDPLVCGRVPG